MSKASRNGPKDSLGRWIAIPDSEKKLCSVKNCERYVRANGLCEMHRGRVRRHGSTDSLQRNPIQEETRKCKSCGLHILRIRKPFSNGKSRFVDENNHKWNGYRCPNCVSIDNRKYTGSKPIDDVTAPHTVLGRRCEHEALSYLSTIGLCGKLNPKPSGPDITISDGRKVEVKSCSRRGGRRYYSGRVNKPRTSDDLVCVVFPEDGSIFLEPMQSYLSNATKIGWRVFDANKRPIDKLRKGEI